MPPKAKKRQLVPDFLWPRVAQTFVGLFFVAAGYFKLTDSFFGARSAPLGNDFNYWLESGFPLWGYDAFMRLMLPYTDYLAGTVIALQMAIGTLLVYNKQVRWAGVVLIFLQTNILLGTINGFGFFVFSGVAIWLGFFYAFRDKMGPRTWTALTWGLIFLGIKYQHQRFGVGDGSVEKFVWQYAHFQQDVMSIHPAYKQMIMGFLDAHPAIAPYLWVAPWWCLSAVMVFMFTPWRIYAGLAWTLIWIFKETMWTTGITGEGTLYVLVFFTWVTCEEYMRQRYPSRWVFPRRDWFKRLWKVLTTEQ